jgi:spoIIIJ-associated protein
MEDFENKIIEWTSEVISLMGYSAQVSVAFREPNKLGLRIDTEAASILIGKKGRNIDSLQLLANVYAGNLGHSDTKIVLDSENYRLRREEALVRVAYKTAEEVRSTGHSILLEPMNPFERRIIHTTLNDIVDIETKSEGDGLMKQVRVMLKGRN